MSEKKKNKKKCWPVALRRLIEIVKFHGTQNLAFWGTSDTLYQKDNGNVLKLNELQSLTQLWKVISKKRHIKEILPTTPSKDRQNEILQILGDVIRLKTLSILNYTLEYWENRSDEYWNLFCLILWRKTWN